MKQLTLSNVSENQLALFKLQERRLIWWIVKDDPLFIEIGQYLKLFQESFSGNTENKKTNNIEELVVNKKKISLAIVFLLF